MRSTFTPAREAAVQRLDRLRIDQRIHLGDHARRAAGAGVLGLARELAEHHLVHAEGRLRQAVELRGLGEAGELQEQLVHVGADLVVAGEQAVVGVGARGARVVVAGAEVAVAADAPGLAAHDQRQLGVGLPPPIAGGGRPPAFALSALHDGPASRSSLATFRAARCTSRSSETSSPGSCTASRFDLHQGRPGGRAG